MGRRDSALGDSDAPLEQDRLRRRRAKPGSVHNTVPSGVVTVVSDQITAVLPLSQISVNLVTATPVPDGGIGLGAETASLACSTFERVVFLRLW